VPGASENGLVDVRVAGETVADEWATTVEQLELVQIWISTVAVLLRIGDLRFPCNTLLTVTVADVGK
jgi:hypothetical protein